MTDKSAAKAPRRVTQVLRDFIWESEIFDDSAKSDIVGWVDWFEQFPGGGGYSAVDSSTMIHYYPMYKSVIGFYLGELRYAMSMAEAKRDQIYSRARKQAKGQMAKPSKDDVMMFAHADAGYNTAVSEALLLRKHFDLLTALSWAVLPDLIAQYANNERADKRHDTQ